MFQPLRTRGRLGFDLSGLFLLWHEGHSLLIGLSRLLGWCFAGVSLWLSVSAHAAADFLPPERAFQVSAARVAADRVEVQVRIASGYYVYRESLRFTSPSVALGAVQLPAGHTKFDENFQKQVETYRGLLSVSIALPPGTATFPLAIVTQGCADAGLCYPPMTTDTTVAAEPTVPGPRAPERIGGSRSGSAPGSTSNSLLESIRNGSLVDDVLQSGQGWRVVIVFFVLGVLISFTPCVLPMLPILSSLIVGTQQQANRLRGAWLAVCYTLGMAVVYTALGIAAGLAGEGLAAQLQTPWMITVFAALLVLFSLSMFDVYELRLPHRFTQQVTEQCNRLPTGQALGVLVMGGLSALMVSPCVTAPLGGALLFISQTGNVTLGGAALFAMACGMGVPLLLLGATSGRWLPRSGPWMVLVKRFFGLLMLGVALWVAEPVLPQWAALVGWGLLLLLLGLLLRPWRRGHGHHHPLRRLLLRGSGLAAIVFGLVQMLGAATGGNDPLRPLAHLSQSAMTDSQPPAFQVIHTPDQLDMALRNAGGRPVLLDFYADWCVSCKEMERFTFHHPDIARRLRGAVLLKADVTANSPQERALLRRFKLFGPPGTIFFDAQGQEVSAARVVGFQPPRRFANTLDAAGL